MWLGLLFTALEVLSELIIFRANMQDWSGNVLKNFNITNSLQNSFNIMITPHANLPTMFGCYFLQSQNQTLLVQQGIRYTVEYRAYYLIVVPQF